MSFFPIFSHFLPSRQLSPSHDSNNRQGEGYSVLPPRHASVSHTASGGRLWEQSAHFSLPQLTDGPDWRQVSVYHPPLPKLSFAPSTSLSPTAVATSAFHPESTSRICSLFVHQHPDFMFCPHQERASSSSGEETKSHDVLLEVLFT